MGPLSRHGLPADRLDIVREVRDILNQSSTFCDAVISDPFIGLGGAVTLDVSLGRETVFRVVAPTEDEAYAVLHELIHSTIDTTGPPLPSAACGSGPRGEPASAEALRPARDTVAPLSCDRKTEREENGMGSIQGFRCGLCRAEILASARRAAPYWSIAPGRAVLCCGESLSPQVLEQVLSAPLPRRRHVRCPRCGYSVWVIVQPVGALACAACREECVAVFPEAPAAVAEKALSSGRSPQEAR